MLYLMIMKHSKDIRILTLKFPPINTITRENIENFQILVSGVCLKN